jgi:hypothetical protein
MPKRSFVWLSMAPALFLSPLFAIATDPLPKDVSRYIEQRETCYHMAGEIPDPSEKERLREVIHEINKQCKGLDKKKLQLRKKYAANVAVTARLIKLEADTDDAPVPAPTPPTR